MIMIKFKAQDKTTGKIKGVTFIDWETHFIKLSDGQLTDFKKCFLLIKNTKGQWVSVDEIDTIL